MLRAKQEITSSNHGNRVAARNNTGTWCGSRDKIFFLFLNAVFLVRSKNFAECLSSHGKGSAKMASPLYFFAVSGLPHSAKVRQSGSGLSIHCIDNIFMHVQCFAHYMLGPMIQMVVKDELRLDRGTSVAR